jgi:hypothetical protein
VTYTAVGSSTSGANGSALASFSLTPNGAGNFILAEVANFRGTAVAAALSSANVSWSLLGSSFSGTNFVSQGCTAQCFIGVVTSTSTATVTITWGPGTNTVFTSVAFQEFSSTTGIPVLDVQGHIDTGSANSNWASLTPAASGELYWGYALANGTAAAGSTTGYVYTPNSDHSSDGAAYNLSCAAGTATFPVWGDTVQAFGIMVLMMPQPADAQFLPGPAWEYFFKPGIPRLKPALPSPSPLIWNPQAAAASSAVNTPGLTVTLPAGITSGNLIVACIAAGNNTATIIPPDNSWCQAVLSQGGAAEETGIWYLLADPVHAGQSTWTFTVSVPCPVYIIIREWQSANGWANPPLDMAAAASSSSTTVQSGTTGVTSQGSELWVGSLTYQGPPQAETGWTAGWFPGSEVSGT